MERKLFMSRYALFKDGKQISKAHKHRICVIIEALERKCYANAFRYGFWLDKRYKIKELDK